jgi:hypothetical protein
MIASAGAVFRKKSPNRVALKKIALHASRFE